MGALNPMTKKNNAKAQKSSKLAGIVDLSTEMQKWITYVLVALAVAGVGFLGWQGYKAYKGKMLTAPATVTVPMEVPVSM